MLISLLYVLFRIYTVETRVHCLDKMATGWTPLGYSCPVNCNNVISAINRLKMMDYEKIVMPDASYENAVGSIEHYVDQLTKHKKGGFKNAKALNTAQKRDLINSTVNKIQAAKKMRRSGRNDESAGDCIKFYKMGDKKELKSCLISQSSGQDVDDIVFIISAALSKYTHTNITNSITKKLMLKMLGMRDLVQGKFDIKLVVKFLTHAFHAYEDIKKNNLVITLKSQHCLTTHVPGCFCMHGYVERFGRCIKPTDCYNGSIYDKYMSRIIVA